MKLHKSLLIGAITAVAVSGCATNQGITDGNNMKAVNYAQWHKHDNIPATELLAREIPNGLADMVFVRQQDDDVEQTSANISINDRYQVSLQPNNYTQVYSCAGINNISVAPTGLKTNDLMLNSQKFVLEPNSTNFFYVDVNDETGVPQLTQIDEQTANELLTDKTYQAHQISRVQTNNCAMPPKPVIKVEVDKPINLHVEFDFDKATIRPMYNQRLAAVAKFMADRPKTVALIEGHTDSRGSNAYNQNLSERRASAVKQELITKYGVNPSRIKSKGFGETRPVASNATDEGRQRNRRVDALITIVNK